MKPALSVIFFTVLGGAGYGVWMLLGVGIALGLYPPGRNEALVPLALGFVLVSAGLLSSTLHLGKPQRAWRAFSQWDSSWLSREGLAAMATYLPALALAGLVRGFDNFPPTRIAAALLCVLSFVTVICTARIYTSLKPIRAWRDPRVLPLYLLFALLSGGLWLWCWLAWSQPAVTSVPLAALAPAALAPIAGLVKFGYWRTLDHLPTNTAGHATGLERIGGARAFESPATEESYLTREMAFLLARKHARKLRAIASVLFALLPFVLVGIAILRPGAQAWCASIAALACLAGLFVERWLFFAEAKHAVAAYFPQS